MSRPTAVALLVALLGSAAAGCPTGAVDPLGVWGGPHVELRAEATGADVAFDCAHGRIAAPLAAGAGGRFDLAGVYVAEHGGPLREGEVLEEQPARYRGEIRGRVMRLEVELTGSGQRIGPFELRKDLPGQLYRCL